MESVAALALDLTGHTVLTGGIGVIAARAWVKKSDIPVIVVAVTVIGVVAVTVIAQDDRWGGPVIVVQR